MTSIEPEGIIIDEIWQLHSDSKQFVTLCENV